MNGPTELFKPKPSRTETKADVTTEAARSIIGAEAARREAKTARLREARLEAEAEAAATEASIAKSSAPASRRARPRR
jgi:hypothetical protein